MSHQRARKGSDARLDPRVPAQRAEEEQLGEGIQQITAYLAQSWGSQQV